MGGRGSGTSELIDLIASRGLNNKQEMLKDRH